MRLHLLLLLLALGLAASAQDTATVVVDTATARPDWRLHHSPRRAALYSALLPGSGQIYNRKYWKAPIVWGAIGVSFYFVRENTAQYKRYTDAYVALVDGDPATTDEFNGAYTADAVLDVADTYRRWRDWSYIALATSYILNVMDASIDAHFTRFDVGRDLSFQVLPYAPLTARGSVGLSLTATF
jgi:hypothetical protein